MKHACWRKIIEWIGRRQSSAAQVFNDWVCLVSCALSAGSREKDYLEIAGRYEKEDLSLFSQAMALLVMEMQDKHFEDVLGPYYLEVACKSTKDARGEFYTPPEVSKMMARMMIGDVQEWIDKGRPIKCQEPASGAGSMILAVAELFAPDHVDMLRFHAWDVARVAADMCYINTTLWGIPAMIVWGNTLSMKVYGSWPNIHYARVGQVQLDRLESVFSMLDKPEPESEPVKTEKPKETPPSRPVQMEFDLKL